MNEQQPSSLPEVQSRIRQITAEILLLEMQRARYEQVGHRLVTLMVEQQINGEVA